MAKKYEKKDNIGDALSVPLLRAAVLNLLCYVLAHYAKPVKVREAVSASEEFIKRAIVYLGEHYTEDVTLEGIAAYCGVSRFHLAREFKNHTGQTVFEYVNMLRCKRASLLLSEGKSVTETAYACGYESLSYFSRVYRKRMGVSPSNLKS
jgi:AraC-like DNA-binding protein